MMPSNSFIFPASFAQQRLWFLEQLDPGKSVYNMLYVVRFETRIDLDAIERSLNEIVHRHESLRTSFSTTDGQPVQVIAKEMSIELPVIDLSAMFNSEREHEIRRWSEYEAEQPFDLKAGPLLRVRLLRIAAEESMLLIAVHHIASDGWSMGVFFNELASLYSTFLTGKIPTLPELPIQYADYSVWQRDCLQGDALDAQLSYWTKHLEGAPKLLELATDRPRPPIQTFSGARRYSSLTASTVRDLRALANRESVTLFMTLLAAFEVLLWRYSGQEDLVVGTPIAGRNRSELEGLIGLLANTLPIRVDVSGNPAFRELLGRVRETALEAYAHQEMPFDKLVEELHPERSLSHTPLFQVIFAFENTSQSLEFPGLNMKWMEVDRGTSRCDLSLFITDKLGQLNCMWEYSTELFDDETIERMMLNYQTLLQSILENPAERIGYLRICAEEEHQRLLVEWNSETSEPGNESCIHQLFEARAEQMPDSTALVFEDQRLTYRDLNVRANQVAHYLQRLGVGPETPVGVFLDRSVEMMVALLGILKAGGAYVPIDPEYPSERVQFMLKDSGVPVLITAKQLTPAGSELSTKIVCLAECPEITRENAGNPSSNVTPSNLAYVIYTSGSTGRPKGVEVTHETVVHLFAATRDKLGFKEGDVWSVVHSSAFDFSVWEIWGCLLLGGCLIVVPREVVQSPTESLDLFCRERVTILNQTPSSLRQLLEARRQKAGTQNWNVRLIVCGGDALDHELAAELLDLGIPLWNFYGPTENTVWTTCTLIEGAPQTAASVALTSIGRPIADMQVYLLSDYSQLVPIGVPGELFIGGKGLARGYLNRPELTTEKFVPNPFGAEPGKRLYRTGDLARYRSDGKIEFLGRLDHQVKLRGFRIELGEIEAALSQHPNVAQAVVTIREDRPGDKRLVAYTKAVGVMPNENELRRFLQLSLPDYMLPSAFVSLEEVPLTPNKKVDRQALPAPDYSGSSVTQQFTEQLGPVRELLANIWARVLGLENIGMHDNFFERGGHSLLATQVVSRIREVFQVELPLRALFEAPTIAELAGKLEALVQQQQGLKAPPLVPVSRDRKLPPSFAQQRLLFLDQLEPGSSFYNIARAVQLCGPLNVAALADALNEIVNRHEALRTVFDTDGEPFQFIAAPQPIPLPLIVITADSDDQRHADAEKVAAEEIRRPFDLSRGPMLRACLIRLQADNHVLVLTLHHIAADGWSLTVLFRELTVLYEAFANENASPLPSLPIQYADFAMWQREYLQGDVLHKLLTYWKKQLAGVHPVLELPADRPRPAVQSFRGAHHQLTLSSELSNDLKSLSRNEGVSLFMTCLATFQLLLSRYTAREDFIVGTDVANRNLVETEGLIGFFTNLLPLRTQISGNPTFTELLRRVRETTLETYAHEDLPFDKLVEELSPPRDPSRNPLVQVLLVMQNNATPFTLTRLHVSKFELPIESSRFDLVLFLTESEKGLSAFWLYDADLFEPGRIAKMAVHFERLLLSITKEPSAKLHSFQFQTADEANQEQMEKKERYQSQLKQLRATRRRGVDLTQASGVKAENLQAENPLPLAIKPESDDVDLTEWAVTNREFIGEKLLSHGAILFRGFELDSVQAFERFAASFCPELFGEYGDLPREELGGKVYGSTPYPADEVILFHNESSHLHSWPMLIWFYCVKAASVGGESPIIDSRKIYQSMEPAIRERFEQKGLLYVRNFTDGLDVSWQHFFHTNDRTAVEDYCHKAGMEFEWRSRNGLRTRQRCPAIVKHPQTGEKVFFNQLQLHHISCLAPGVRESLLSLMKEEDLPRNVYYGDGSPIEDSVVAYLGDLYTKLAVSFPWQEHDILMLNNMLVAHSRNSFVGERKIVVALGNLVRKEQIEHWERIEA